LLKMFKEIYRHRDLVFLLAVHDVRNKHIRSALGLVWALLYPILFIGVYFFLFTVVFKIRFGEGIGGIEFFIYMLSGFVAWLILAEVVSTSSTLVNENQSLFVKIVFPVELLSAKQVLVCFVSQLPALIVVLGLNAARGHASVSWLLIPVLLVLQGMMLLGVSWLVSVVAVFLKDIERILSLFLMLGVFATPIFYTMDNLGPRFKAVMAFNPLVYLIRPYQQIIYYGEFPDLLDMGLLVIIAVVSLLLGGWVFHTLKQTVRDEL